MDDFEETTAVYLAGFRQGEIEGATKVLETQSEAIDRILAEVPIPRLMAGSRVRTMLQGMSREAKTSAAQIAEMRERE